MQAELIVRHAINATQMDDDQGVLFWMTMMCSMIGNSFFALSATDLFFLV